MSIDNFLELWYYVAIIKNKIDYMGVRKKNNAIEKIRRDEAKIRRDKKKLKRAKKLKATTK
ncbi:hypothetical protein KJ641_04220 [Patescibacteria group bacterium]|nr:hypothetical protein [Patescibacteria group bacterium]MBU1896045.1 hypothetical protein [Patescibacteria group bacterium]